MGDRADDRSRLGRLVDSLDEEFGSGIVLLIGGLVVTAVLGLAALIVWLLR
jgi:hypothetical protein